MKVLSKVGGFAMFQGEKRSDGKPFYKFEYNHKNKDGTWETQEFFLFPEQSAAMALAVNIGAQRICAIEAENATNAMQERMANKQADEDKF